MGGGGVRLPFPTLDSKFQKSLRKREAAVLEWATGLEDE